MSPDPRTRLGPSGVVVGIGGRGLGSYDAAVRLGAEEAALRQVSLRLVHGSRPVQRAGDGAAADMGSRQQRGRRLVNGVARDLAETPLGQRIQIWTESSPQTGVDLLLSHSRTAAMIVLQRSDDRRSAGSTTIAVTAAARCPTLVTRPGDRLGGDLDLLVLLDEEHDPAPALALAFAEAALRGVGVVVLDGRRDGAAARTAVGPAHDEHPDVAVRYAGNEPARSTDRVRELSADVGLLVLVRPGHAWTSGLVVHAVGVTTCPVALVAPLEVRA